MAIASSDPVQGSDSTASGLISTHLPRGPSDMNQNHFHPDQMRHLYNEIPSWKMHCLWKPQLESFIFEVKSSFRSHSLLLCNIVFKLQKMGTYPNCNSDTTSKPAPLRFRILAIPHR